MFLLSGYVEAVSLLLAADSGVCEEEDNEVVEGKDEEDEEEEEEVEGKDNEEESEEEEDEAEEDEEVDEEEDEETALEPGFWWTLILMGLLCGGLGRTEAAFVGEGIRTLRLGVLVVWGLPSLP